MLVLFLTVFIDLVGFGVIIPLLPFYGEHFRATPDVVALVMSTYSLAQFIAAPFWGAMSDRRGRKPVLIITLAGAIIGYVMLGMANSLWMLFAARAFGGFMAGNIGTAFAYVADVTTPENRARGMGLIGAAFGLGFIAGPAIGGILAGDDPLNADFATPAFLAAVLSAVALVMAVFILKESLSAEVRARLAERPRRSRWSQFGLALRRPHIGSLLVLNFFATFVFAGMESTFAMWSEREFAWGPRQNGYLFAYVGLLSATIQGGLIGRLAKRFGESKLVILGASALGLGLALVPVSGHIPGVNHLPLLLIAMGIIGLGFSISTPSLNSLISQCIGESERGAILGVTRSVTTMARVTGPAAAGMLFAWGGRDWPFAIGALVMAGVALLSLKAHRRLAGELRR